MKIVRKIKKFFRSPRIFINDFKAKRSRNKSYADVENLKKQVEMLTSQSAVNCAANLNSFCSANSSNNVFNDIQKYSQLMQALKNKLPLAGLHNGVFNYWFIIRLALYIRITQLSINSSPEFQNKLKSQLPCQTYLNRSQRIALRSCGVVTAEELPTNLECDFLFMPQHQGSDLVYYQHNSYVSRVIDAYMEMASEVGKVQRVQFIGNHLAPIKYQGSVAYFMRDVLSVTGHVEMLRHPDVLNHISTMVTHFSLPHQILCDSIDNFYNDYYAYCRLLEKMHPKVVFLGNMLFNLPLYAACRKLGIASVDLQHGNTIGTASVAYSNYEEQDIVGDDLLPTDFICYSQRDYDQLEEVFPKARVHNFGYFWPEYALDCFNITSIEKQKKWIKKKVSEFSIVVIVTISWTELDCFLPIFNSPIAAEKNICFIVRAKAKHANRLSPLADRISLPPRVLMNQKIFSTIPLPILMEFADIHLTMHSASVYEADCAGVSSFVCGVGAMDSYSDLIESNVLFYIESPDEFYDLLPEALNRKKKNRFVSAPDGASFKSWLASYL